MNDFLQDLSTSSLITAIEENLFFAISTSRHWSRAEFHDDAEIKWSMTDIPFPLFNSIWKAQLPPERIDTTIRTLIAQAKSRKVPLLWWMGPSTQPNDLARHLERYGFTSDGQIPGMAVNLTTLNENLPIPTGLIIQRVEDHKILKQWNQVFAAGFGLPDFAADAFYDYMCAIDLDTTPAYIGWLDNQPVATSLLVLAGGIAGIYNVATLPRVRRQGIGAIMTLTPLREARNRGCRVGILQASQMGVGVYRTLGFQEYCKISQYVWSPDHQPEAG